MFFSVSSYIRKNKQQTNKEVQRKNHGHEKEESLELELYFILKICIESLCLSTRTAYDTAVLTATELKWRDGYPGPAYDGFAKEIVELLPRFIILLTSPCDMKLAFGAWIFYRFSFILR